MDMADHGRPKPLIAGNWKMNGLRGSGGSLVRGLLDKCSSASGAACDILICPPATLLEQTRAAVAGSPVLLGAQDCHPESAGAHTGDISAEMLADAGCSHVIVGHSERRADHGEDDRLVRAKAAAAFRAGLIPIVCVGETLAERDAGRAEAVVTEQLSGSIPPDAGGADLTVAYEPVWAIGTGRTPTASDIVAMHGAIRSRLGEIAGDADAVRILYGGSVKPENAAEILAVPDVDGALVGGASLDPEDFWAIIGSCP